MSRNGDDEFEFDFEGNAESARDEGIGRVREHNPNFMLKCLDELRPFKRERNGRSFIAEEFRHHCQERGLVPRHPNAWGSMVMNAVRYRLIEKTGVHEKMTDKKSHARQTPLYRFCERQ